MIETNFKLYQISKCGYYPYKGQTPNFADLGTTFENLILWAKSVSVAQSATFEPDDETSVLKCYVYDCLKSETGDYYFTIWNEVPATEQNAVGAISGTKAVGKTDIVFKQFGKDYIPGFATYFWVNTANGYLSTVRFRRSYNGHQSFKSYVRGFMKTFSNYCVHELDPATSTIAVTGYAEDGQNISGKLYPRFETESLRSSGPIQFIRENLQKARAVIKKELITKQSPRVKSIYDVLYKALGSNRDRHSIAKDITVKYELPFDLTASELEAIYKDWRADDDPTDDYGFKIGRNTYWFSHEVQKTDLKLEVKTVNPELYDLGSLASQIERNKERILNECLKNTY